MFRSWNHAVPAEFKSRYPDRSLSGGLYPMSGLLASESILANMRLALSALEKDLGHIGDGSALGLTKDDLSRIHGRATKYRRRIYEIERKLAGN